MIPESERTCSVCAKLIPHGVTYYRVGGVPYCGPCFTAAGFCFATPTPEAHDGDE